VRDAAMALFAEQGFAATPVRAIAGAAGVSAPSVIRLYGSKEQLAAAVDDHVVARISGLLDRMLQAGSEDDARTVMVALSDEPDLLAYLARALTDGGEGGRALFDRLYATSLAFVEAAEDAGIARPLADRPAAAAWLLAADIGVIFLRRYLASVLGSDPFTGPGIDRLVAIEMDVLTRAYLTFDDEADNRPTEDET
jgi:AcrR family transcriptional regulator